jgi:hypothetical protein
MSILVLLKKMTNLIRACNPSGYAAAPIHCIKEILLPLRRFLARLLDLNGEEPALIPPDDITATFAQAIVNRRTVFVI